MKNTDIFWFVYGVESGELMKFETKREALRWLQDVKRFDRENGIDGERWTLFRGHE